MDTPPESLDQSVLYMRIIFAGMPAMMVYNFGAAILRAVGDTRRPPVLLLIAGVVNVGLNLFFVCIFHMGVAGVALATVISQCISAALVVPLPGAQHRLPSFTSNSYISTGTSCWKSYGSGSRRDPGCGVFRFQRFDPVLHQYLRLYCGCRQYGGLQYRRVCLPP